jgi:hypothetical protein
MQTDVKTIGGVRNTARRCLLTGVRSLFGLLIAITAIANLIGQLLWTLATLATRTIAHLITNRVVQAATVTLFASLASTTSTSAASAEPSKNAQTMYKLCERQANRIRKPIPREIARQACTQITVPQTTTTVAPTTLNPTQQSLLEQLAGLQVASEQLAGYKRDAWPHWSDFDGDGCNTRKEILKTQSATPVQVEPPRCTIVAGNWTDPYTGIGYQTPSAIEIDHLVPLANAHRSGGHAWTTEQREQFANDQTELIATSSKSNTTKADKRPDQWLPPLVEARCWYVTKWISIKTAYKLTIMPTERDTIRNVINTNC